MKNHIFFKIAAAVLLNSLLCYSALSQNGSCEIKWDKWGVPHISATTDAADYYGFGWSQMKAHANLILKSYGKARGRAAEYWGGTQHFENDVLVRKLNVPARAQEWYDLQDQKMKSNMSSFVAGMNDYCRSHADEIPDELKVVLPIKNTDPLAKLQISYHLMVGAFAMQPQAAEWKNAGSNAWALAPSKTESGNTILLMQPHPPWIDDYLFFEAHLQTKDMNMYGIALIGMPSIAMGFNENLGWGLTFNQADAMDLIELTIKDNSYLSEGKWKLLETKEETINVKVGESIEHKTILIKKSDYGHIIDEKNGKALALRLSGLDRPFFVQQFAAMAKTKNLNEFENAMKQLQLPLQNIIYADKKGNILYLYNGIIPKRPNGTLQEWSGIIPATKPGALVTEYIAYEDLPKIINPRSGFVANSNNGPWTSTYPFISEPANYPSYISNKPLQNFDYRSRRSIKMILSEEKLSFDKVVAMQSSTYAELADRTVDELVAFAAKASDTLLNRAAVVLKNWDRKIDANSRGAVLFINWVFALKNIDPFLVKFSEKDALNTPHTVSIEAKQLLLKAASKTLANYGSLDVPCSEVYSINYADKTIKGGLGLNEVGSFNAGFYRPLSKSTYSLAGGSAYTLVVEFGAQIKAKGILSYGNATQKKSPFIGDQLQLLVDRKLRDIWFYQKDIDQNIYLTEILTF